MEKRFGRVTVLHAAKHADPSASVAATGKASGSYSRTVTTAPHQTLAWEAEDVPEQRMCLHKMASATWRRSASKSRVPWTACCPHTDDTLLSMSPPSAFPSYLLQASHWGDCCLLPEPLSSVPAQGTVGSWIPAACGGVKAPYKMHHKPCLKGFCLIRWED